MPLTYPAITPNPFFSGQLDYVEKLNLMIDEINQGLQDGFAAEVVYKGVWDASSGSYPVGASTGYKYIVSTNGTLNSISYSVGDYIIYKGSSNGQDSSNVSNYSNWTKISSPEGVDPVIIHNTSGVLSTNAINVITTGSTLSMTMPTIVGMTNGSWVVLVNMSTSILHTLTSFNTATPINGISGASLPIQLDVPKQLLKLTFINSTDGWVIQ